MTDLVRQTVSHLLLPLMAIGGVLAAAVLMALPLWAAFECGRGAHRRRATERTRAQIAHITERAKQRLATERASAEIEADDDGCWLEIGDDDADAIDPTSRDAIDECALHPSRSSSGCRDLAQEEQGCLAPLPALALAVASPDSLISALFQAARADVPDPLRAQLPSVVAATLDLAAEIIDACGFPASHPGRRNAERAVLAAMAYGVAPHRISRN